MSPAGGRTKRCIVAYALRQRQFLWPVELPEDATIADALAAAQVLARRQGEAEGIPWDSAAVGIFGEPRGRVDVPRDGDRVELYRPLPVDPRAGRRERVRRGR